MYLEAGFAFVGFMIILLIILWVVQKVTGIQIFDDTPMDDDWFHW